MPMTWHPFIFAICPTWLPTAPAAPEMTTVSPDLGLQISRKPKYAVSLKISWFLISAVPVYLLNAKKCIFTMFQFILKRSHGYNFINALN